MSNNIMDMESIKNMIGQTAFNVQNISEQMGVLTTQVKELKINMMRQDEKIQSIDDRLVKHENRITVDVNEANNIKSSIHKRAAELLGIYYVDGVVAEECVCDDIKYRGKFISRCYVDARKESRLGTPLYTTFHRDYMEVLDYINAWVPPTGVEGYKEYLDKREEVRKKKNSK